MNYTNKISIAFILLFSFAMFFQACEKEVVKPENPFDKIDHGNNGNANDTVNAASLLGIHRNILIPKCAMPACHDGTFEPDYRTLQSSFTTMVYHPIIKNNDAGTFEFRVVPFDPARSVLFERITNCCFVNENDRMPQDNIGTPLPQADINNIRTWIENGAPNQNGVIATPPDREPLFPFYLARTSDYLESLDTIPNRVSGTLDSPFKIPLNMNLIRLLIFIEDDLTPLQQMQYNKLYLSTSMNDFSNPIVVNATFLNFPSLPQCWMVSLNVDNLPENQQIFMRYNVNDGGRPFNTQFPKNSTQDFFKEYWSFIRMN
jgi:hypothetical protein